MQTKIFEGIRTPYDVKFLIKLFSNITVGATRRGCWIWEGYRDVDGYGSFSYRKVPARVHRLIWILLYGAIPDGMCICHKCDVPACCNPKHLFIGTHADNVADRHKKGRDYRGNKQGNYVKGSKVHSAKLTEAQVREIRELKLSHTETAELYGVSRYTVGLIRSNRLWRHVV